MQSEKQNLFKQLNYLNVIVVALLTYGCSFAPIGENKFDYNRKDSPNEYCRSIKAIERSTQGELPETRFEKEFDMHDYDRAYSLDAKDPRDSKSHNANASNAGKPSKVSETTNHNNPLGYPMGKSILTDEAPIRVAPVIQRVYIKSYVDADDILIQDQIIYKEIAHSKWTGFESGIDTREAQINGVGVAGVHPHRNQGVDADTTANDLASPSKSPESKFTSNANFSTNGSQRVEDSSKSLNNLGSNFDGSNKLEIETTNDKAVD